MSRKHRYKYRPSEEELATLIEFKMSPFPLKYPCGCTLVMAVLPPSELRVPDQTRFERQGVLGRNSIVPCQSGMDAHRGWYLYKTDPQILQLLRYRERPRG